MVVIWLWLLLSDHVHCALFTRFGHKVLHTLLLALVVAVAWEGLITTGLLADGALGGECLL